MAGNLDTSAQLRFLATVRRQSAPPRCNPFVIVLQVLAIGMIFIGLTMTIIAHWPGSTSIGENPLRIAGPIVLSIGFVALIIGIVLMCMINQKERVRWQRQMEKIISAKQQTPESDVAGMSGKSVQSPGYQGHMQPPFGAQVVEPDSHVKHTGAGYHDDSANLNDSTFTDGDNIPMPVRVKKPRRPRDQSGEGDLSSVEDLTVANTESAKVVDETAPKKRRRPKPDAGSQQESMALIGQGGAALSGTDSATVQPSPGEARRLKVHIKAQPGASVRIQNTPPPVAAKPAFKPKSLDQSTTSAETDI